MAEFGGKEALNLSRYSGKSDSADDLQLLLECLHFQKEEPSCVLPALATITAMFYNSSKSRDLFRSKGGLRYVLELVYSSSNHRIQQEALYTLGCAAENNVVNKMKLCEDKLFCLLSERIFSSPHLSLLTCAAWLLGCVLASNGQGQNMARKNGVLHTLIALFKTHLPDVSSVPKSAADGRTGTCSVQLWASVCGALCAATNNPQNEINQSLCSHVFPAALSLLHHGLSHSPEVLRPALSVLSSCIASNVAMQGRLCTLGGLSVLVKLLKDVMSTNQAQLEPPLLEIAVYIVKALSAAIFEHVGNCGVVCSLGVVPVLLLLLKRDGLDCQSKLTVIMSLGLLIEDNQIGQRELIDNGGLKLLLKNMANCKNEELCKAATFVMQCCVLHTDTNDSLSPRCNEDEVMASMSRLDSVLHPTYLPQPSQPSSCSLPPTHADTLQVLDSLKLPVRDRVFSWLASNTQGLEANQPGTEAPSESVIEQLKLLAAIQGSEFPSAHQQKTLVEERKYNGDCSQDSKLALDAQACTTASKTVCQQNTTNCKPASRSVQIMEDPTKMQLQNLKSVYLAAKAQSLIKPEAELTKGRSLDKQKEHGRGTLLQQHAHVPGHRNEVNNQIFEECLQEKRQVTHSLKPSNTAQLTQSRNSSDAENHAFTKQLEKQLAEERKRRILLEEELAKRSHTRDNFRSIEEPSHSSSVGKNPKHNTKEGVLKLVQAPRCELGENLAINNTNAIVPVITTPETTFTKENIPPHIDVQCSTKTLVPITALSLPSCAKKNVRYACTSPRMADDENKTADQNQVCSSAKYYGGNASKTDVVALNNSDTDNSSTMTSPLSLYTSDEITGAPFHYSDMTSQHTHPSNYLAQVNPNNCSYQQLDSVYKTPTSGNKIRNFRATSNTCSLASITKDGSLCVFHCLGCKPRLKCPLITSKNFVKMLRADRYTCFYHKRLVSRMQRCGSGSTSLVRVDRIDKSVHYSCALGGDFCARTLPFSQFKKPRVNVTKLDSESNYAVMHSSPSMYESQRNDIDSHSSALHHGVGKFELGSRLKLDSALPAFSKIPVVSLTRLQAPRKKAQKVQQACDVYCSASDSDLETYSEHHSVNNGSDATYICSSEDTRDDSFEMVSPSATHVAPKKLKPNVLITNTKRPNQDLSIKTDNVQAREPISTKLSQLGEKEKENIKRPMYRYTVGKKQITRSNPPRTVLGSIANQNSALSVYEYSTPSKSRTKYAPKSDVNQDCKLLVVAKASGSAIPRLKFTRTEEKNLIQGVRKIGKRWRHILAGYSFDPSRTVVDLNDKYCNLRAKGLV